MESRTVARIEMRCCAKLILVSSVSAFSRATSFSRSDIVPDVTLTFSPPRTGVSFASCITGASFWVVAAVVCDAIRVVSSSIAIIGVPFFLGYTSDLKRFHHHAKFSLTIRKFGVGSRPDIGIRQPAFVFRRGALDFRPPL